jgi:type II secretory pathway component GspD/PulD (secretin)
MNSPKYTRTIFSCIVLTIAVWSVLAQSQPVLAAQNPPLPVGRDNPFAKIVRPATPNPLTSLLTSSDADEEKPELFMQTVMLKFLDAKSLKEAIETMSSEYGSIAINQTNNSLIICDTEERLARILSEIKKADKTPQQIMVEVVIVDVQLSDETEIGVNWDILSDKNYDIGYRQNLTTRLGSTIADADTIGNATAFNTTGIGGNFSVVISGTIRNVVAMLQQKRNVEILASPRAMMVSGKTASIKAVEEIPYSEVSDTAAGGAAAITSTQFKEVGVTLQVSATITDGNNIFLTVDAEQNVRTGESSTGVPVVDTRRADTSLLLKDGQIVVMGGLRRQEKTDRVDQIPILGDIPLIGFLFKYTNTVVNNTELIVFISPHIYKEGEPIPEDAMLKFEEIRKRPVLLLPEDAKLKGYREQLDQQVKEQSAAFEQLQ